MYSPELNEMLVPRYEDGGGVYDIGSRAEEVDSGMLLELTDFHNSAQTIGSTAALGTRVFKESVMAVTTSFPNDGSNVNVDDVTNPFLHVWRLHGSPNGRTIYTTPSITLCLQNFYIRTQALKDYFDNLTDDQKLEVFAKKGSLVVRDVIYDDGDQ